MANILRSKYAFHGLTINREREINPMTLLRITATLICCGILLVGCSEPANQVGQAARATSFNEGLLKPEVLPMNTPKDVEPYADPAVL
ncbi:MAG: hypothetical protein PVF35_02000, partial [Gammaproteobacteria bacterium]